MMISYNTLLKQSLSEVLQSPRYIPLKKKINTDQLNNACLVIVVNYNTLVNYEKANLPADRFDSRAVSLQDEEIRDQRGGGRRKKKKQQPRLQTANLIWTIPAK